MLLKSKLNKVKSLLEANNVLTSLEERYCYAKDALNLESEFTVPDLVVFVETIEEVQNVVKFANEHEIPIIARGAGTNMVGACVCTNGGIVLNFSKMNKILDIDTTDMIARVQPGVVLGDLKSAVEKRGLFYPPDPSNYKVSTIGGSIAQSSGGAKSFKYGTTKDYVLSLKVVTATGELMQIGAETVKDSTGYHLSQLIIGSEGTLAIVVEATLKLIPMPESNRVITAYFSNYDEAVAAVENIISAHIYPAAIDFMDQYSMKTVEDFVHCGLKTDYECVLLIDLDGLETSMEAQILKTRTVLEESGAKSVVIPKDKNESELIWRARRSSFAAATRLAPDVVSDDIIVPRKYLSQMVNICKKVSKDYDLILCMVGHIGDGNLHPQFVLNLKNENEFRNYMIAKSKIYEAVKAFNGTVSAEHGIGVEKKIYLENTVDMKALEYMKLIKKVFDPKNILNPGKVINI